MNNDLISPAPIFKKYFILLNRDKITSEYKFEEKDVKIFFFFKYFDFRD